MKLIHTENAPRPAGHYSQAVASNGLLFVSGQLPIDAKTGQKVLGSIEEQTTMVLQNLGSILDAGDSSVNDVLKVTVYISDIQLWDRVNKTYQVFFGEHKPARAVVPTRDLHFGFKIEVDAIARVRN